MGQSRKPTVQVRLVWPASRGRKVDCCGETSIVWATHGDVQDYPAEKWHLLDEHPDVWELVSAPRGPLPQPEQPKPFYVLPIRETIARRYTPSPSEQTLAEERELRTRARMLNEAAKILLDEQQRQAAAKALSKAEFLRQQQADDDRIIANIINAQQKRLRPSLVDLHDLPVHLDGGTLRRLGIIDFGILPDDDAEAEPIRHVDGWGQSKPRKARERPCSRLSK